MEEGRKPDEAPDEVVYLVIGSCGEYSDHTYWHVAAYRDEAKATEHATMAKVEADRIRALDGPSWERVEHACDPHYMSDYTGTRYDVISVPLRRLAPLVAAMISEEAKGDE